MTSDRSMVFEVDTKNVSRSEAANGTTLLAFHGQTALIVADDQTMRPHAVVPVRMDGYGVTSTEPYVNLVLERDRLIALATVALAVVRELDARAADAAGYASLLDDPNSYVNERR